MSVFSELMGLGKSLKNRGKKKSSGGSSANAANAANAAGDDWSGSFKRGGKVRKTGIAKVHKGEEVLTAKQAKKRHSGRGKTR